MTSQKKIILKAYTISRLFPTRSEQRHCRNDGHKSILRHWHAQEISRKDLELYKISRSFLTEQGKLAAKMIVRKHRLWEVLSGKIRFLGWGTWNCRTIRTHQIRKLINKWMIFRNPTEDPHGDPIPNARNKFWKSKSNCFRNLLRIKKESV
jgi:DtxR family Mn-dependent transcriptional regulator